MRVKEHHKPMTRSDTGKLDTVDHAREKAGTAIHCNIKLKYRSTNTKPDPNRNIFKMQKLKGSTFDCTQPPMRV